MLKEKYLAVLSFVLDVLLCCLAFQAYIREEGGRPPFAGWWTCVAMAGRCPNTSITLPFLGVPRPNDYWERPSHRGASKKCDESRIYCFHVR